MVTVEQDGPCMCMYVLSTIWDFILYIGFTYMYVSRIICCMALNTWLHIKLLYEVLDNVFVVQNFQTLSFKFSQVVFAPIQKKKLMFFQCKLLWQQLCKSTPLTYDLGSIWNFGENMKKYVYYHLSKFQLIYLHKMKFFAISLKSLQTGI
jgi:hypothetical protein